MSDDKPSDTAVSITVAFGVSPAGAPAWIVSPSKRKISSSSVTSIHWNLFPLLGLDARLLSFAGPKTTPKGQGPGGSGLYFASSANVTQQPELLSPCLYRLPANMIHAAGTYEYIVQVIYNGQLYSHDPEAEFETN